MMRRGIGEGAAAARHVLDVVGALHGGGVAAGVERDLEARRRDGPCIGGARDDMRRVVDRLLGLGLGRSARVILWRTPGCCWFQSVKAAWPVRTAPD